MRPRNLIALLALTLGMAVPAAAQQTRQIGFSVGTPSFSGGVSFGRHGHASVRLGFGQRGSRARGGYVSRGPRQCSTRVWVPGHYETDYEQVWIPSSKNKVWIEPVYETRYDNCGTPYQVLVRPGCYQWVTTPGHYETRSAKTWIRGRYELRYTRS